MYVLLTDQQAVHLSIHLDSMVLFSSPCNDMNISRIGKIFEGHLGIWRVFIWEFGGFSFGNLARFRLGIWRIPPVCLYGMAGIHGAWAAACVALFMGGRAVEAANRLFGLSLLLVSAESMSDGLSEMAEWLPNTVVPQSVAGVFAVSGRFLPPLLAAKWLFLPCFRDFRRLFWQFQRLFCPQGDHLEGAKWPLGGGEVTTWRAKLTTCEGQPLRGGRDCACHAGKMGAISAQMA